MKKTKDEILTAVKGYHDEPNEDAYIALLEDLSDSFEDVNEELTATIEELTTKLNELNQKYIDRFFKSDEDEEEEETPEEDEETEDVTETEIDDLFEEDE